MCLPVLLSSWHINLAVQGRNGWFFPVKCERSAFPPTDLWKKVIHCNHCVGAMLRRVSAMWRQRWCRFLHNTLFESSLAMFVYCSATDWHIVEIDVHGTPNEDTGDSLHVHTVRRNPSARGRVTGSATLASFLSSVLRKFQLHFGQVLCSTKVTHACIFYF